MSAELTNLAKAGVIFPFAPAEMGLVELRRSGRVRLKDASRQGLALASKFDLAYNGAFALALAALHAAGYKPKDRIYAFQCLAHTTTLPLGERKVILRAHTLRNQSEYEGEKVEDLRLIEDLIAAATALAALLPDP